jgi:hypothetical protein
LRLEADREAALHERGDRQAWQIVPGQRPGWDGDRRSRPEG